MPKVDDQVREGRISVMTYHAALARMAEGDQMYEELLTMKFPTGLVFDPKRKKENDARSRSSKSWIEQKSKKLNDAQKVYQSVILLKNAHWVIAAAARIGQLFQDFANGLYTAEVPTPPAAPPGSGAR